MPVNEFAKRGVPISYIKLKDLLVQHDDEAFLVKEINEADGTKFILNSIRIMMNSWRHKKLMYTIYIL